MDFDRLTPLLPTLSSTEQLLLINLVARAQSERVAASQADLAVWTGIKSRNTIKRGLRGLIDRRVLRVVAAPTQDGAPATFEVRLASEIESVGVAFPKPAGPGLSAGDRLRLAAIKQALPPARWETLRREAALTGESEEDVLIRASFGPLRLHAPPTRP
jgi:hypothetical protein